MSRKLASRPRSKRLAKESLAPRKRPRQERSQATFDAILQAAAYLLTRRGWAAFTTNEVAKKAGVNIASLYQYFPNKEAIVAELQRRHVSELESRWPSLPPGLPLEVYLRGMIEAVVREHRVQPALHRVFAEELPRSSRLRERPSDAQARWSARVAPLLEVPDEELAGFVLRTAIHAVIHEAAARRPEVLEHPLLVEELTRLSSAYLSGR